jgi:DNA repair protein RadA/Sms
MARLRLVYNCSDCGASYPKWTGKCTACGSWNSLVEDVEDPNANSIASLAAGLALVPAGTAQLIGESTPLMVHRAAPASANLIAY